MSSWAEWRKVGDDEWWLVYTEAPKDATRAALAERWPPPMAITWSGHSESCVHLRKYYNGVSPDGPDAEDGSDYVHVCDPRDLIDDIQAWMDAADYFNWKDKEVGE